MVDEQYEIWDREEEGEGGSVGHYDFEPQEVLWGWGVFPSQDGVLASYLSVWGIRSLRVTVDILPPHRGYG